MKTSKREDLSPEEIQMVNALMEKYLNLTTFHFGKVPRKVMRYDKRPAMYGGKGTVFLLQMFSEGELVNNRIGAYMILPTSDDSVGFHTHGTRNEQELYVIIEGKGHYLEKDSEDGEVKTYEVKKGNITTIKDEGFHGIKNVGHSPLIVFVITTNQP